MNFHPDFAITGEVVAVSPRTGGIKLRSVEDGVTRDQWYKLSYYAHPALPKKGRRVEISISAGNSYFVNSWIDLDTPAAPYKVEPEPAGEDIPFEVQT